MNYLKKFENFNSKASLKDLNNDEHIIEFQIEEGESFEDAKKRLLKDIKFSYLHKNENNELIIAFKDVSGTEHKSKKILMGDKSLDDIKKEFFDNLRLFWISYKK
jgi:hypothetical protein